MSCICEYYSGGENNQTGDDQVDPSLETTPTSDENGPAAANSTKEEENDSEAGTKDLEVSASDLADCQAENWLLKKKLLDYEVTIENLEQLVTTIVEKQHQILSEMFQLRKENRELLTECQMQREYHFMERNALMKELHDLRTLPVDKRRVLECPSGSEREESDEDVVEEYSSGDGSEGQTQNDDTARSDESGSDDDENYAGRSSASETSGRSSSLSEASKSTGSDSDEGSEDEEGSSGSSSDSD
ncbi:protein starmaker [Drosophila bipectinata]|uniref:protein starmaker n=1 Tax=Drosophila bipectinata TaxID=42026 RepID=UPI0038B256F9